MNTQEMSLHERLSLVGLQNISEYAMAKKVHQSLQTYTEGIDPAMLESMMQPFSKRYSNDFHRYALVSGARHDQGYELSYPPSDSLAHCILTTRGALAHSHQRKGAGTVVPGGAVVAFEVLSDYKIDEICDWTRMQGIPYHLEEKDEGAVYINHIHRTPSQLCIRDDWENIFGWFYSERFLVSVVADWAQKEGFPTVMIEPGNINYWYSRERHARMMLRYNGTAKMCGFKRRSPDGPYVLDLR